MLLSKICLGAYSLLATIMTVACTPAQTSKNSPAIAHYLANEGVMVVQGQTKIVFDPLFNNTYGQYLALPPEQRAALFAGDAPYDGIDGVFISHHHGDHFDPKDILALLRAQKSIQLFAPTQAVNAMKKLTTSSEKNLFTRITEVNIQYGDEPINISVGNMRIEAVNIPHAGWPNRMDIQNLSWRVTLHDTTTIVHMGDADINDRHFSMQGEYWEARKADIAFPPYWFLQTPDGQEILTRRVQANQSIGIHVPAAIPAVPTARPAQFQNMDIFTTPGETRQITLSNTQE